jgi:putative zinc finger/helix-turn-helix YgiT family protein
MAEKGRIDFCTTCRKETEYSLQKETVKVTIKDKDYEFNLTAAICCECGNRMDIPGLLDLNNREIDEQYREKEGLIRIADIENLMKIYRLGKAPLSLALGFGEITVSRYLNGQMPSKEYSDIMKHALDDPDYMQSLLDRNRSKIADEAYNKACMAIKKLKKDFHISDKLKQVISYIFQQLDEVTPLMLQKLLYYTQAIYITNHGTPLFVEDCQAWIHGPVYRDVYDLFRDFQYNPIEDFRFAVMRDKASDLTEAEKESIDLVLNTFGIYGGKTLERITHRETPWINARRGYAENEPSQATIEKDAIKNYFETIDQQYGLKTEGGIAEYIHVMLK